jgi:hypothetical protein
MSKSVGKHPKFHILCKRCNSYRHTVLTLIRPLVEREGAIGGLCITCRKCLNTANDFDEKFEDEEA